METGRMVTLVDGTEVDSASQAWRHECEARAIAALWSLDERRACLDRIETKRGKATADELRATMRKLWDARQKAGQ